MIPHNVIDFSHSDKRALHEVVDSEFYTMGKAVSFFEEACAQYFDRPHALAVSSGSMALRLALIASGVKYGDNVIVPAYSCSAICNTVLSLGANVLPCEIEANTCNIDASHAASLANTHDVDVVIAVNTFGIPANISELRANGLIVIEDCSHGFAINDNNSPAIRGDIAIQSFYATKLFGAAEMGVLLLNDEEVYEQLKARRVGYSEEPDGFCLNIKPDEFNAALALSKINVANELLKSRKRLASRYLCNNYLATHCVGKLGNRVWYRYVVAVNNADELILSLGSQVEMVKPVTNWVNVLSIYPNAQLAFNKNVSIPLYPSLSSASQDVVINLMQKQFDRGMC